MRNFGGGDRVVGLRIVQKGDIPKGAAIQQGPQGGRFYITPSGKKVYIGDGQPGGGKPVGKKPDGDDRSKSTIAHVEQSLGLLNAYGAEVSMHGNTITIEHEGKKASITVHPGKGPGQETFTTNGQTTNALSKAVSIAAKDGLAWDANGPVQHAPKGNPKAAENRHPSEAAKSLSPDAKKELAMFTVGSTSGIRRGDQIDDKLKAVLPELEKHGVVKVTRGDDRSIEKVQLTSRGEAIQHSAWRQQGERTHEARFFGPTSLKTRLQDDMRLHHGIKAEVREDSKGTNGKVTVRIGDKDHVVRVTRDEVKYNGKSYKDFRDLSDAIADETNPAIQSLKQTPKEKVAQRRAAGTYEAHKGGPTYSAVSLVDDLKHHHGTEASYTIKSKGNGKDGIVTIKAGGKEHVVGVSASGMTYGGKEYTDLHKVSDAIAAASKGGKGKATEEYDPKLAPSLLERMSEQTRLEKLKASQDKAAGKGTGTSGTGDSRHPEAGQKVTREWRGMKIDLVKHPDGSFETFTDGKSHGKHRSITAATDAALKPHMTHTPSGYEFFKLGKKK